MSEHKKKDEHEAKDKAETKDQQKGAKALLDHLKETGTGEAKLKPARDHLKANPNAGVLEIVKRLVEGGASDVTLAKVSDYLGFDPTPEKKSGPSLPSFPVRAPALGVTVGGKTYGGGERVPDDVVAKATPEELQALLSDTGHPVQQRLVAEPTEKQKAESSEAGAPPPKDSHGPHATHHATHAHKGDKK